MVLCVSICAADPVFNHPDSSLCEAHHLHGLELKHCEPPSADPRPQTPPREWGQTFQPTLASGTQSSYSLGIQLSRLLPWFTSYPHRLPLTSDNLGILNLPPFSPQSNEVLQSYPPWGKVLLTLLTVFTILPIPVYSLYILLNKISPDSMMHHRDTDFFKDDVKEEKQKTRPRLPVGQSLKKMNKNR